MSRTRGQNPDTSVYDHVHTPMINRPAAMYGARRPAADLVRSLARPSKRVGEPADEAVGGEGEGDGQGARHPGRDEQGEQHPRHRQVGPGPHQAQRQPDEAPQAHAVDARPRAASPRSRQTRPAPSGPSGTTSVTGEPSAVPGPDTSERSPGPAASGPSIPPAYGRALVHGARRRARGRPIAVR